ncbi:hypothetical protein A628_04108 [Salmonella enterica subsp. enterica serovar Cubana str. 76814]|uniref:Uncharacterized protein n=2 Tax=Salmonella TaxID=590 RepID=V7IID6_SALET|nr:hypothetical protein A628_04108 [Salmonella enterica subsp. enterica serovar Cubana str. 76814]
MSGASFRPEASRAPEGISAGGRLRHYLWRRKRKLIFLKKEFPLDFCIIL